MSEIAIADELETKTESYVNPKWKEAYGLKLAGKKPKQIALMFRVDERTVYRWLNAYRESYCKSMAATPAVNLIADQAVEYAYIADEARKAADATKSETQKRGFWMVAIKAAKARQELLLETGIMPKEPERLYTLTQAMKPKEPERETEARTNEEIKQDIIEMLKYGRRME